jgi:hypothetical protein
MLARLYFDSTQNAMELFPPIPSSLTHRALPVGLCKYDETMGRRFAGSLLAVTLSCDKHAGELNLHSVYE